MNFIGGLLGNRNAAAWMLMMATVALHVLDETLHDFLPFYNETVLEMREGLGFFPMPTFTFDAWLGGLIVAIIIGFAITPIVRRDSKIIRIITTLLGLLMVANALGHMLGSIYLGRLIPGFWSSPLLLAAAIYVVIRGFRRRQEKPD